MGLPFPVIVVPGITATYLVDQYPVDWETIWGVRTKRYERATLHPDNLQLEAREPARVRAGPINEIAYQSLVEELRYNLAQREDEPVPVYAFSYDWRYPLDAVEAELALFVDEVIERTKLMPHYHRDKQFSENPRVNLVGHSMGGLVITGYLQRAGAGSRVHKVATLATPFQGSFEAPIKVLTGTADLGTKAPSSRERESARLTPALYHLLPSFERGIDIGPGLPDSFYDTGTWQTAVFSTIAEFIRLHGIDPPKSKTQREAKARDLMQDMLDRARTHRTRVDGFSLQAAGLTTNDWLCVVGVNSTTRVRMAVRASDAGPKFELHSTDRENDWASDDAAKNRRDTGDGTVPFEGAVPRFLDLNSLVCVTPQDYGYWEIGDRVLAGLAGFHGLLPAMNMIHRLLVRHFTGQPDKHGNTWGRRAPGVDDWTPPLPLDEKT